MKALPVFFRKGEGYFPCSVEEATHVTLRLPGPTGKLTLPIIRKGAREGTGCWSWNGSTESPTLRPSILTQFDSAAPEKSWRCHSWINEGAAQFLEDCTHEFAGKLLPLLDLDETGAAALRRSIK